MKPCKRDFSTLSDHRSINSCKASEYREESFPYSPFIRLILETASLVLYQYQACPFCVKVRRAMKRQGLKIETRDVKRSDTAREELLAGGRDLKVPCLRVGEGEKWSYESDQIIGYLEERFSSAAVTV